MSLTVYKFLWYLISRIEKHKGDESIASIIPVEMTSNIGAHLTMSEIEDPIPQAAAIPFRETAAGTLEVLITRRQDKQKWGIPKGIIDPGHSAHATVRIESEEEAGIAGCVSQQPIGSYDHHKWGTICHIQVFLMRVTEEYPNYLEQQFRERRWFPWQKAARMMGQKPVRELMAQLPALIAQATFDDT